MSVGHFASSQPIAYLTDEDIAHVRATAQELGAVHSLVVCLLHEPPITIAGVARQSLADLAEDRTGKTFVILGRTAASRTPGRSATKHERQSPVCEVATRD
jgi:hypothetical protein